MKGGIGLDLEEQGKKSRAPQIPCYSKFGPLIEISGEMLRKAEAQAPPHTCLIRGWVQGPGLNKCFRHPTLLSGPQWASCCPEVK